MLQQLSPVELQSVLQSIGQVKPGFKFQDLGDLYDDVGLLPGFSVPLWLKLSRLKVPVVEHHKVVSKRKNQVRLRVGWSPL